MGIVRGKKYPIIDGRPAIEIRVEKLAQLFDERDPAPFLDKDLDEDAEEYIVSSLREIHTKKDLMLAIFCDREPALDAQIVTEAIHKHFSYKAEMIAKKIRARIKHGIKALAIGLSFLFIAILSSALIPDKNLVFKFFKEGLMLLGWVSMWYPANIFLYEWWPMVDDRKLMIFLSKIEIRISKQASHHNRKFFRGA